MPPAAPAGASSRIDLRLTGASARAMLVSRGIFLPNP